MPLIHSEKPKTTPEERLDKSWTWLAKQERSRHYHPRQGDCFRAAAVLYAIKIAAGTVNETT